MNKITLPAEKVKKAGGTPKELLFLLAEDGHLSVVRVHSFDKQKKQSQAELLFTTFSDTNELHDQELSYYINATEARRDAVMLISGSILAKGKCDTSVIDAILEMPASWE
jgi:hypothetical protein